MFQLQHHSQEGGTDFRGELLHKEWQIIAFKVFRNIPEHRVVFKGAVSDC